MGGRVSINFESDAFWWKQLMSMHLPSSPHAKQLPFWRKRKERTPWKASRAQRRKRSRGRFWRIWVFFTPAIPGKHGKTVLPAHIVLSSYSMFHIFLWPRPSQDPCFWPNVAAGSQEQRRKQRLLVFLLFLDIFFFLMFICWNVLRSLQYLSHTIAAAHPVADGLHSQRAECKCQPCCDFGPFTMPNMHQYAICAARWPLVQDFGSSSAHSWQTKKQPPSKTWYARLSARVLWPDTAVYITGLVTASASERWLPYFD